MKLEKPADESDDENDKGPLCVRHEYIQDYSLEFSVYHQDTNHYQITLPRESCLMSEDARCLILRVVVHDCGVASLFSKCSIKQAGATEGINLSNHIFPQKGIPLIFETMLPWSKDHEQKICIEWSKTFNAHHVVPVQAMHQTYPFANPHHSTVHSNSIGNGMNTFSSANFSQPQQISAIPNQGDLTHGIIYIGVSGYLE